MELSKLFVAINETYLPFIKSYDKLTNPNFKGNQLAHKIRHVPGEAIPKALLGDKYVVKGSAGQGGWARIPWIAIFDKEIHLGAQAGFDIVYLFTSDMEGVYLSLNQGWTYYEENYKSSKNEDIVKVANYWKKNLVTYTEKFNNDKIKLMVNTTEKTSSLVRGYELGNICSKYYKISEIMNEDTIISDLFDMMVVFKELKSKLIGKDYKKTIDFILQENFDISDEEVEQSTIEQKEVNKFLNEVDEYTFIEVEPPRKKQTQKTIDRTNKEKKGKHRDYKKEAEQNIELGYAGEEAAIKLEKDYLNHSQRPDLAEKVRHVSKHDGDGLGYDILSFDLEGKEKYIEVKTTNSGLNTHFFISENEIHESEIRGSSYYLYRFFNFGKSGKEKEFYILNGSLREQLKLKSNSYSAFPFMQRKNEN
ncbi:hypothetical protein CKN86_09530 [Carnobacterium divergens]|uniref:MrcB family domain-containing protein n=1 Tax=Carnobacterium divergens TaxID=2748 RepID=UPI000D4374C6|nr:DUF3578 domain-containing protein [Carnobacterium divergens]MCO6019350.1 DUF3578 domain-containing protein [Carnobacterium divergens]TFI60666.1 hypothetical protein CKN62_09670 [Carnobacterium divergens]TFI87689.1 hypothetical protein CKN84_09560 [Carnobacterium divergens]TFJ02256.1 hypothetical protein CKN86_09530 [Carnobacterium divergens]TFJ03767.1 hypothetical protein CKN65_09570 [Carnobacterium divergens]